jgi:methionyl-tRNA formyltransferase
MRKIKIGYFADGPWSHRALTKLLSDEMLEVAFICARADSPDPILRDIAVKKNLAFMTHPKINSDEFFLKTQKYDCDLFVSMSFNQIFRERLINAPRLKTINCHAGKLPFYRGRNILNWALINDEKEFGITVHYVDEGIDTGDIILQRCYPISDDDDYATLLEQAYGECANNLYDAIKAIQLNCVKPVAQKTIHRLGFYCSARTNGDEVINWEWTSREVFNFVRALCRPGPQARSFLDEQEIKIDKVQYLPDAATYKGIAGAVVGVDDDAFFVKTSDSFVRVVDWSGYTKPSIGDRFK